jgi:hypothetical protein
LSSTREGMDPRHILLFVRAKRGVFAAMAAVVIAVEIVGTAVAASARVIALPSSTGAAGALVVKVLPGEVDLVPGDLATIVLVLSNETASPATVSAIEVLVPQRLVVDEPPQAGAIGVIPAGGDARVPFRVKAEPGLENGEVDVLVHLTQPSVGPGRAGDPLVSGSMAVRVGKAAQALTAAFVSAPGKLDDGRQATAWLRVANDTPFTFEHIQLVAVNSYDVVLQSMPGAVFAPCAKDAASAVAAQQVGCLDVLKPGESHVVGVLVTVQHRVRIGTQQVAVVVRGEAMTASGTVPSTVVAATPVDVAVFGLDALGPFGITSLFILPGIVAVVTALLLARLYPRRPGTPDTVDFKDPSLLVIVAPLAALVYGIYWLVWGVNLTDSVGTADVELLFALGVILGAVAWGSRAGVYWSRSGRLQFSKNDTEDKVLKRLAARHGRLSLPEVTFDGRFYRFLSESPQDQVTVCSPITYTYSDDLSEVDRGKFRQAVQGNDIARVRSAVRRGEVTLRWLLPSGVATFANSAVQVTEEQSLFVGDDDI